MTETSHSRSAARAVWHDLQHADAEKIVRVVAILDRMSERGAADEILVPLRDRLARLRPPRPLRFSRLLFQPLDPLIVPASTWRRGSPAVPRSVVQPIANLVHIALGRAAAPIEAIIAGHCCENVDVVAKAGAMLWPLAVDVLTQNGPPPRWTDETGLQDSDFATLSRQIAAALGCGAQMAPAAAMPSGTSSEAGRVIGATVTRQPQALVTVMALLMVQTSDPQSLLFDAEAHVPPPQMAAVRLAMDDAYDFLVNAAAEASPLPADIAVAEHDLRKIVKLVESHERRTAQTAERSARVDDLARRMSQEARTRFDAALSKQVLLPMRGAAAMNDDDVATVEAMARDLRRFEATARHLGAREHYDRQLRQSVEVLRPEPDDTAQRCADKLRLVEILAGPELAMAMLTDAQ